MVLRAMWLKEIHRISVYTSGAFRLIHFAFSFSTSPSVNVSC